MKKIVLFVVIILTTSFQMFSQCPSAPAEGYTCIPDSNFEQALFDLLIDSVNGDNQISNEEAESRYGYIDISSKDIMDLTGIEAFVNLTSLKASSNPFTNIDLSSNIALEELNLNSTGISDLNLSNNVNLTALNLSYCTNLTSLDLSSNLLLSDLNTEECNLLTNLNIDGLTSLVSLNLWDNDLSLLDVSLNLGLESLVARQNQLSSLDLSNNTALTYVNVNQNSLTSLDMRNGMNANITFFNADFNSDLICLYVDDPSALYLTTIPWSIDENSNFINTDAECNLLSIIEKNETLFSMHPNPATHTLRVNATKQNLNLNIYNILGKQVMTETITLGENTLNINQLSSGIYLVRLSNNNNNNNNNTVETKKLVVN